MDDEPGDDTPEVLQQASAVRERAQQVHDRAVQSTPADPQRAVKARRHEVETLEHAIGHHQQAAELQQRYGRPERAAEATAHAEHARELLAQARAELAKDEADAPDAASS